MVPRLPTRSGDAIIKSGLVGSTRLPTNSPGPPALCLCRKPQHSPGNVDPDCPFAKGWARPLADHNKSTPLCGVPIDTSVEASVRGSCTADKGRADNSPRLRVPARAMVESLVECGFRFGMVCLFYSRTRQIPCRAAGANFGGMRGQPLGSWNCTPHRWREAASLECALASLPGDSKPKRVEAMSSHAGSRTAHRYVPMEHLTAQRAGRRHEQSGDATRRPVGYTEAVRPTGLLHLSPV